MELDGSDATQFFAYNIGNYGGTQYQAIDQDANGNDDDYYGGQPAYRYDNATGNVVAGKILYYGKQSTGQNWTAFHDN